MSLAPELTALDRRVLEAVRRPQQVGPLTARLRGREWLPGDPTVDDIEQILRGLEHLGYVRRKRGGWWQAT